MFVVLTSRVPGRAGCYRSSPGAEVAPRSDVVGEDFQGEVVRQHFAASPGVS